MSAKEREGDEPQQESERAETHRAGMPGGGVGRREEPGKTGVHPFSEATGDEEMPTRTGAEWGQGLAGPAGYEDSGSSELSGPWATDEGTPTGVDEAADDEEEGTEAGP